MISIIIPTLNEEECIQELLDFLVSHPEKKDFEVIVVDGGSQDRTKEICESLDCKVITSARISRANQMNVGAEVAKGDVLYFVHADTLPPRSFVQDIYHEVSIGITAGCYRFRFKDKPTPLLHINDFFICLPFRWCRGGDQTLFIASSFFKELNGFNERYVIMEDFELLDRIFRRATFKVLPKSVSVSSRKYKNNSYFKVQLTNLRAMKMYKKGEEPKKIKQFYHKKLTN